jgi:hypothetical protein
MGLRQVRFHWRCSAALALLFVITGCNLCSDEVIADIASPDGSLVATAWVRDCGATTPFFTSVAFRSPDQSFPEADKALFVVSKRLKRISLQWRDAKTLEIRCDECPRYEISNQRVAFGDVDIVYDLSGAP